MSRALLFDIDGTLVDTLGAGRAALATALRSVFGTAGPVDTFDFHGRTDPAIVKGLLTAAGVDQGRIRAGLDVLWDTYYDALERELARRADRVRPFPGARELLDALAADAGFAVGLVTGNMEPGAERKLRWGGLAGRFAFGAYGSDSEIRDELPALAVRRASELLGRALRAEEAVVIGDTPLDVRCARAAGARALAVATGRHSVAELRACGADRVAADLRDTEALLAFLREA